MSSVKTEDESWLYVYDPETKQQSSQRKSPSSRPPKRNSTSSQQHQFHANHFFNFPGNVHKEIVPPGQTFNGTIYCKVLRRLRENVRRKLPEMLKNGEWLWHHHNAPAHTSLVVRESSSTSLAQESILSQSLLHKLLPVVPIPCSIPPVSLPQQSGLTDHAVIAFQFSPTSLTSFLLRQQGLLLQGSVPQVE